jgi:hypothetical protein
MPRNSKTSVAGTKKTCGFKEKAERVITPEQVDKSRYNELAKKHGWNNEQWKKRGFKHSNKPGGKFTRKKAEGESNQ